MPTFHETTQMGQRYETPNSLAYVNLPSVAPANSGSATTAGSGIGATNLPPSPDFAYTPIALPEYTESEQADLANIDRLLGIPEESDYYATNVGSAENAAGRGFSPGAGFASAVGALRQEKYVRDRNAQAHEMLQPYLDRKQRIEELNIQGQQAMERMAAEYGANANLATINNNAAMDRLIQQAGYDQALQALQMSHDFNLAAQRFGFEEALNRLNHDQQMQRDVANNAAALERDQQQQAWQAQQNLSAHAQQLERDRLNQAASYNETLLRTQSPQLDSQVKGFVQSILGKYNAGTSGGSQSVASGYSPGSSTQGTYNAGSFAASGGVYTPTPASSNTYADWWATYGGTSQPNNSTIATTPYNPFAEEDAYFAEGGVNDFALNYNAGGGNYWEDFY